MAETIYNARLGETWEAVSAGTKPAGYTHPLAIKTLAEIGIVLRQHPPARQRPRGRSAPGKGGCEGRRTEKEYNLHEGVELCKQ